jgi:hypothetical protein
LNLEHQLGGFKSEGKNMRLVLSLILFIALVPGLTSGVAAQGGSSAAQNADDLRLQLLDVQGKEAALQERARQLDENLKPENIERSLAGIGSTKPEELRELRRRQLTIDRESVRTQLKLVATSREHLETAIRTAETAAYQQSAEGINVPTDQILMYGAPHWLVGILGGVIALLGIVLVVFFVRRP